MDDAIRAQAREILKAIGHARARLHGTDPAERRAGLAQACFSAYTSKGPLAAHVRDVCTARGVRGVAAALDTLEALAKAFAEDRKS